MAGPRYIMLEDRGIVTIGGEDRRTFLQGLISNDVSHVDGARSVYAAFLTAQGKYLHDFFVAEIGDVLALDCERQRSADLARRLRIYRLRAKVSVEDRSADWAVVALIGEEVANAVGLTAEPGATAPFLGGVAFVDPRLAEAGVRAILPAADAARRLGEAGFVAESPEAYDRHRLALGLADGSRDMELERTILLECGFDELHGVDWEKGCFLGQELTARTKYRGLIRKRLIPVLVEGPLPAPGTPIHHDDREVGEMRSGLGDLGLAMLRLEALEDGASGGASFTAGEARLSARLPAWLKL
ncbi:MAG: folate-binding protein [Rhodospirillales bacterium]|nr:folate-binding protein [Rhodospirillales bacterium]